MFELALVTVLAAAAAALTATILRRPLSATPDVHDAPPAVFRPAPTRRPLASPDARQSVDPLLILRQTADAWSEEARAAGVTMLAPAPASGFSLQTRPALLAEILDILMANAVRGNRPGGAVLAELRQTLDGLAVRIHDTGPGLASDDLARLFRPIDGGDRGLPQAWRLARVLGGRLTASSTPGEGSTFTLALPARPSPDLCASILPAPNPLVAGRTLLLVEPDPAFAALLRQVVSALGAALHVSPDGEEGLTLARDLRPDLILIEPALPGMGGAALRTALDADPLTHGIPVVAISADPLITGQGVRFDARLGKPLDIPFFVLVLSRILTERPAPRAFDAA